VSAQKRQLSRQGASVVRWRADGKELFYIDADDWITATEFYPNGQLGTTRRLFRVDFPPRQLTAAGPAMGFDVAGDGKRFVVPETSGLRPSPFVVIQNWTASLRGMSR
jgi:hypothetical protein